MTARIAVVTANSARFFEHADSGGGGGVNADRPRLSSSRASNRTAREHLAGSDGWNPLG